MVSIKYYSICIKCFLLCNFEILYLCDFQFQLEFFNKMISLLHFFPFIFVSSIRFSRYFISFEILDIVYWFTVYSFVMLAGLLMCNITW